MILRRVKGFVALPVWGNGVALSERYASHATEEERRGSENCFTMECLF